MNIQQLEYVIAVDTYRHFATAAERCFVTQPTLSMMIHKLEEELEVQIFDRSRQPVVPTEAGEAVVAQARVVSRELRRLKEVAHEQRGELSGEIKLGIIPTVAPYLLPMFLRNFLLAHPRLRMKISELTTEQIIERLERHQIDAAILATPLHHARIRETPLYYEEFVVYASSDEKLMKKKMVVPADIDIQHVWLLEEGHCLRSQVLNLCELRNREQDIDNLEYEVSTIESLVRMVDMNKGVAVLPQLALREFSKTKLRSVRRFKSPVPAREISIVCYKHFVKQRIVDALSDAIRAAVPVEMRTKTRKSLSEVLP